MTVAEMIKELEKFPKDAKIGAFVSNDNCFGAMREVSKLGYFKEIHYVDVSADEDDKIIERE